MNTIDLHSFDTLNALLAAAANAILKAADETLSAQPAFHFALAGGNTPRPLYQRLARSAHAVDWRRAHFWWGDERCVPSEHPDSNFGMAQDAWLSRILPPAQLHRIRGELGAVKAAARYQSELRAVLGPEGVLDLALLGVGADGHTASLFPDARHDPRADCVAVLDAPKAPAERVSLGERVLRAAERRIFVARGPEKEAAIRGMTAGADSPAARVARGGPSAIYYCPRPR